MSIKDVVKFSSNFADMTNGRCVTGMDTRPSSDFVMRAVHAGLMANGVDIYNMGMMPTPVVFREARKVGAGVMITSSHNPLEWNGLKFILNGRGINESELPHIVSAHDTNSKDYSSKDIPHRVGGGGGDSDDNNNDDIANVGMLNMHATSYVSEAAEIIGDIDEPPRIIADIGGGAALYIVRQLYDKIGCKIDTINTEAGSRGPDPTTDPLSTLVRSSPKYDMGFAFDLDGDRLVIVRDGKIQTPDVTLGLGVAGALEMGYKKFVLSIDTSLGVERLIEESGGVTARTKVGEANVVDHMIKSGSDSGGEGSSGGFILSEFNYCRDGILAGGMIASMLQRDRRTRLKEILDDVLSKYHTIRTKIQADSALHKVMMQRAQRWMESECSEVQTLDGIKGIINDDSWILVRGSNTEEAIRISAESKDPAACRAMTAKMGSIMRGLA